MKEPAFYMHNGKAIPFSEATNNLLLGIIRREIPRVKNEPPLCGFDFGYTYAAILLLERGVL